MKKFGLRSLLVVVSLIAIVVAAFGNQLKTYRTECREIGKISGSSTVVYQAPTSNALPIGSPRPPQFAAFL